MKTTPYTPPAVYCLFTSSLFYVYSSAPGSRALASVMDAVCFYWDTFKLGCCLLGRVAPAHSHNANASLISVVISVSIPHTHSLASTPHTLPRNRSSCYFLLYLHPLFRSVFVLSHTHCTARMHTHTTLHTTRASWKKKQIWNWNRDPCDLISNRVLRPLSQFGQE